MEHTVTLNIPRLGDTQDFSIVTKTNRKDKYVCSTWEGDGLGNKGNWNIIRVYDTMEYVAIKA